MNVHWIDWTILIVMCGSLVLVAFSTRAYTKNVADFLAAGRSAGRYLLTVSEGASMEVGAIALIARFEMQFNAGLNSMWWRFVNTPILIILALSGWIVYRFRQTRCLTLAQFFEERYSRKFRVFTGLLCFISGIINFGIFPGVGSRFLISILDIPDVIPVLGVGIPSFPLVMFILLFVSGLLVTAGGQITVMVTDFLQGSLCNIIFVAIAIFLMLNVDWSHISETLLARDAGCSLSNPFDTSKIKSFNMSFYLINYFYIIYMWQTWQGSQAYNSCAKSAHEARMGKILTPVRSLAFWFIIIFAPLVANVILSHPDFSSVADSVNASLNQIDNETVRNQMITPVVLGKLLPVGLLGCFAVVVFSAFVSTHDTYLHSWGSIFIQDVIMPFRKKPFSPRQHMWALRLSIIGVAVFIFIFSLVYNATQHIVMFWMVTGAIYVGGAGTVLAGGLYWKRGTTAGAFAAMIVGSSLAVTGYLLIQFYPGFPLNGQHCFLISALSSMLSYVTISLLTYKKSMAPNFDKIFHRGNYAVEEDHPDTAEEDIKFAGNKIMRVLGITNEFNLKDKFIYFLVLGWAALFLLTFLIGTLLHFTLGSEAKDWIYFWRIYLTVHFCLGVIFTVWLLVGGLSDLKYMFKKLRMVKRDETDDGWVGQEDYTERQQAVEGDTKDENRHRAHLAEDSQDPK